MSLSQFIKNMPKVELHVHMEGSIRPETLLKLAARHQIKLPADTVEGLREWYTFTDFAHFIEIYRYFARCLRTPDDIELLAREFITGQAEQNIRYSEVTFTPYNQFHANGMGFSEQLAAINRARVWGETKLNTRMGLVIDIPREISPEEGLRVADWAIEGYGDGVVAFGLGGDEYGNPPEKFTAAFDKARAAGLPCVPHAGETQGPPSIWGAINALGAQRIGHGVRCLEDPDLVTVLRERQIPLEVCPSSNVCLKVVPDLDSHPLPQLLEAGLLVTLNSDDPPMFNTSLTEEYQRVAETFEFTAAQLKQFVFNAINVSVLPENERSKLTSEVTAEFQHLEQIYLN